MPVGYQHRRRVVVIPRRWLLRAIILVLVWINSQNVAEVKQLEVGPDDAGRLPFTMVVISMSYFLQTMLGFTLVLILCISNDRLLVLFLRFYFIACNILLGMVIIVAFFLTPITRKMENVGYEEWREILEHVMKMIIGCATAKLIQELLRKYY